MFENDINDISNMANEYIEILIPLKRNIPEDISDEIIEKTQSFTNRLNKFVNDYQYGADSLIMFIELKKEANQLSDFFSQIIETYGKENIYEDEVNDEENYVNLINSLDNIFENQSSVEFEFEIKQLVNEYTRYLKHIYSLQNNIPKRTNREIISIIISFIDDFQKFVNDYQYGTESIKRFIDLRKEANSLFKLLSKIIETFGKENKYEGEEK